MSRNRSQRLIPFVLAHVVLLAANASAAPSPPEFPERGRFADFDGLRIHYRSLGAGEPVLLFAHGWSGDGTVFRMQARLAAQARLLVVDLPGHGLSSKPTLDYTPDLFARALDAVLRDAGVARAVLVGHSNGVGVIRQFYRRFPEKTSALVALDGTLRPFRDAASLARLVEALRRPDYVETAAGMIGGMLSRTSPELRADLEARMLATPQEVMASSLSATGDPALWTPDLIRVPLLCVLARAPFWSEEYEAFVRGLAPQVDFRRVDGVGHFLMLDDPTAVHEALLDFLSRQKLLPSVPKAP